MWMDQISNRLPGVIDICVYGKDTTEHDRNLLQLMKTAEQQGLVLNSSKCVIHKSKMFFYGAVFTAQGTKQVPLQDLPAPKNAKQLQSFLGLINYLQPFLPGPCI